MRVRRGYILGILGIYEVLHPLVMVLEGVRSEGTEFMFEGFQVQSLSLEV